MYNLKKILIAITIIALLSPTAINAQNLDADLLKAASKGQIDKVQTFLSDGADINAKEKNGTTALMYAAEKGYIAMIKFLLEHGIDPLTTDGKNETALQKAIKKNKIEAIKALGEETKYRLAERDNTIDAYENFLQDYPNTKHRPQVEGDLSYLKAEHANTIEAFDQFLQGYPNGRHANDAQVAISYLKAKEKSTLGAYNEFLEAYPNSKYSNEVRSIVENFSVLDVLVGIATKFKSENYTFTDEQIVDTRTKLERLCDEDIVLPKSKGINEIQYEYGKMVPLDSLKTKYGFGKNNYHLIIALSEIQFRLSVPLQVKMEEMLKGVGFSQLTQIMHSYMNNQRQMVQHRTIYLAGVILLLDRIDNNITRERCWLAIDRMLGAIDLKKSEGEYHRVADFPFIIYTKPGEIVELLRKQQAKETNQDVKKIAAEIIEKIEQRLTAK